MLPHVTGYVYFIQAVPDGLIKIGYTRHHPDGRLANLRIASPVELAPLGYRRGSVQDERDLHFRFAVHRDHGEWFRPDPEILAYVAERAKPWSNPTPVRRVYPPGFVWGPSVKFASAKQAQEVVKVLGVPTLEDMKLMSQTRRGIMMLALSQMGLDPHLKPGYKSDSELQERRRPYQVIHLD